jgi:AcrR family transcriptional regulator
MSSDRPRRADAQRNYDLLLVAAKKVFAERGVDAPLDDIAKLAGVGNATMYRHFPTRSDVIVAVFADEVAELCAQGESLLGEKSSVDALFTWLRLFIAHVAGKRELALAVADDRGAQQSGLFAGWHEAMVSAASALLARAQRDGVVRDDVEVLDLLTLANGLAVAGAEPVRVERLLALIRRGADAL